MAIICDLISKGYKLDCLKGMGGIKNIYIAPAADYTMLQTGQNLTSIGTLAEVFKWEFTGNTTGLVQTVNANWDTGTLFYSQVLSLSVPYLGYDIQNQLDLLFRNRSVIFIEDYNGNILALGVENFVKTTNGTMATGLAKGDMSGYTAEFTAEERLPAPFLTSTAKTALIAAISTVVVTETPVV